MTKVLAVGDQAPNFDLTSTEGVVLMLQDEVPRSQVLLVFFDEADAVTADLEVLARRAAELAGKGVKIMAVSEAALEVLTSIQRKLALPFPLLHDDRGLSKVYKAESGASATFVLVDRDQRVAWIERSQVDLALSLSSVVSDRKGMRQSTSNYPRSVINRLVDFWVN